MSFQGHVEKGMVVLDRPLPLPDGTVVQVEPISAASDDFWRSCSLDELARLQGVAAPGGIEVLLGGWPEDERDDQFEETFLRWRESEREFGP
jgi:hypothetical protein